MRLVLHGGAGDPGSWQDEAEARAALERIAAAAWAQLTSGGAAIDVVQEAVRLLEDCPLFNSGIGSVLNADGEIELDAAIMEGTTRRCGAVASVSTARSPIRLARAILERTAHVLVVGDAADRLNRELGLEVVDPSFFILPERRDQLAAAKRRGVVSLDHDQHHGTVGCVVRDSRGELAAATSTGGLTNKRPGRVGDSPLIGAGTFADDRSVAVSCTGTGESFIRSGFAAQVHGRILFGGSPLADACAAALADVGSFGGRGGCIAVDHHGEISLQFNTKAMYRAWVNGSGTVRSAVGP